jgi:hypothetical protein
MLEKMKMLLGITGNEKDGLLQFVLDTVTDMVKTYCNMKPDEAIPDQLNNLLVRMAVDMWRAEGYGNEKNNNMEVTSVRRGDVTTSFRPVGGDFNTGTGAGGADFIKAYTKQLNTFRKVGW